MGKLHLLDLIVLVVYLAGSVGLGCWFAFRNRGKDDFMAAGGKLPGWLVGLSVFGAFVSSITFLALPATAYTGNWIKFAFSLSLPIAAFVSVKVFVPFYRRSGDVSAYEHLEHRFGAWARLYADVCYLLMHLVRMGAVMYLLALPLEHLLHWPIITIILVTGALTTIYTCLGGIEGVIWTDAAQSVILIGGALTCAVMLPFMLPHGPAQMFHDGIAQHKFGLGPFTAELGKSTFWITLLYGVFTNIGNFGVDQTFVQRYHTASSEREARKSVWLGALTYLPISAVFLFIGTGLFYFYQAYPARLTPEVAGRLAAGKADDVFANFIVDSLPQGLTGLLIAAVFAGAMATLSSNLNSAATLTFSDLYRRYLKPEPTSRESMGVLYGSTVFWGILATITALGFTQLKEGMLDAWWTFAGVLTAGMLGLFLLRLIVSRAGGVAGAVSVVLGTLLSVWMVFGSVVKKFSPGSVGNIPAWLKCPLHDNLVIVVVPVVMVLAGLIVAMIVPRTFEADRDVEVASGTQAKSY